MCGYDELYSVFHSTCRYKIEPPGFWRTAVLDLIAQLLTMHFGRVGGADYVPFTNSFPEPPLLLHIPQERSESFSDFVTAAQ